MYQQSEVVSLLMAVALAPVMYASVRRIRFAGKAALAMGLAAMVCAYVFTVVETTVLPDVFNVLEHVSLAVSGVAFALGMFQLTRSEHTARIES